MKNRKLLFLHFFHFCFVFIFVDITETVRFCTCIRDPDDENKFNIYLKFILTKCECSNNIDKLNNRDQRGVGMLQ